jgi:hypothetical protein
MSFEIQPADSESAKVVPIGRHRKVFPLGIEARHRRHGWVLIEDVRDNERLVRWYEFRRVPEDEFTTRYDEFGDPIVAETELIAHREWVAIDTLRRVRDPDCERPEQWKFLKRVGALHVPGAKHRRATRQGVRDFLPSV